MDDMIIKKASPTSSYQHKLWNGGQQIVSSYTTLENYASTISEGKNIFELLARPVLLNDVNGNIEWHSVRFSSIPKPLSQLDSVEQVRYREILTVQLNRFRGLIEQENSANKKEMLQAAFTFAGEANVYCGNDQVTIVEWGMFPKEIKPIDIYATYLKGTGSNGGGTGSNGGGTGSNGGGTGSNGGGTGSNGGGTGSNGGGTGSNGGGTGSNGGGTGSNGGGTGSNGGGTGSNGGGTGSNGGGTGSNGGGTGSNGGGTGSNGGGTGSNGGGNGIPFWGWIAGGGLLSFLGGRNWWWILLLFLLLLLLWFFMRSCNSKSPYLPEKPGMMKPIVEDDIIDSPDSTRRIVGDRLNVLISDGGTVIEFAKAFKEAYPQDEYQIVYYDELIPRAQIQFPREKRDEITNELPSKLKQFELTLFDESLFGNNFKPQDPAFLDTKKSWYFDIIKCYTAWDVTQGCKNIVVAIIDDGFDLNHPELSGKIVKPYNAVTRSPNINSSKSGHGTHVAGTAIGKMGNSTGSSGIAPECMFMPIQVANSTGLMSTTAIIDGVLYAITQGAQVVNLSLGMHFNQMLQMMPLGYQRTMIYNSFLEEEYVWNQIYKMAEKHNCTLVLAAGNENVLAGIDPMQRNPLGIKVAAIQPDLQKADFSNFGEFATVSAPGVEIYNAIPGSLYTFMQGTSMASPIVAGAVALLKSKNPQLTSVQVSYILQTTGLSSPSFVGKIIQLDKALGMVDDNLDNIPTPQKPIPGNPFVPQPIDPNNPFPSPTPNPPGQEPVPDCDKVRKRVGDLERELDYLRRTYPGCLKPKDPLKFDSPLSLAQLNGRWKSSTPLFNTEDQLVELYFEFNGTNQATFSLIEPDGTTYRASLSLSISGDVLTMSQPQPAQSPDGRQYNPYHFICRPNNKRIAECIGINQVEKANRINFQLLNMN